MGMLSKSLEQMYKAPEKRVMSPRMQAVYYLCAALAMTALIAGALGADPVYCQIVSTVGILGMVLLGIVSGILYQKSRYLMIRGLVRDVAIGGVWILVLLNWISESV